MIVHYNKLHVTRLLFLSLVTLLLGYVVRAEETVLIDRARDYDMFLYYRTNDQERAVEYAELIAADEESSLNAEQVADVCDFLAEYCETTLHRYGRALELRLRSADIYTALGDRATATRNEAHLSRLYLRNGDYHNAFSHGVEVLHSAREEGDSLSVREAYLVLEQVTYYYHQDYDMAMTYNRLVADSYSDRAEAQQAVRALNNRFNYTLQPEEFMGLVERSEAICLEYGFDDLLVNVYLNMSMHVLQLGDTVTSAEYLEKAHSYIHGFKEEGYYYSARGFYHLNTGDTSAAIDDLLRSIELLNQGDFDSKNVHSYFLLQDIYHNEGRHEEAYDALMAFSETYTRQHNTDNVIELSLLINDMELEQAAEERRQLEQRHLLEQKHARFATYSYIIIIVIVIGIVVLVYSRYRLERKNRQLQKVKAEQDLNYKNEIIKIQRLQQFQEQKNNEQMSEELNRVVNISDARELRTELRRVIRQLQSRSSGGDWADVEMTLANANDTLYVNLLKEYPNLTKNERKLCMLIHMKLSTKEIANITHQSTGSINVARSRLRQKFGLTDSDLSLIAFLDRFKG